MGKKKDLIKLAKQEILNYDKEISEWGDVGTGYAYGVIQTYENILRILEPDDTKVKESPYYEIEVDVRITVNVAKDDNDSVDSAIQDAIEIVQHNLGYGFPAADYKIIEAREK